MFKEFDVVRLKEDDIDAGVKASYLGTIVDVIDKDVFTVEFFDDEGNTIMPALLKTYSTKELIKL